MKSTILILLIFMLCPLFICSQNGDNHLLVDTIVFDYSIREVLEYSYQDTYEFEFGEMIDLDILIEVLNSTEFEITWYKVEEEDTFEIANNFLLEEDVTLLFVISDSFKCIVQNIINIKVNMVSDINEEKAFDRIKIFPNPTKNVLNIEVFNLNKKAFLLVEIFNHLGQSVIRQKINPLEFNGTVPITLNQIGPGYYTILIHNEVFSHSEKIIKF